jgi:glycosyltransferase involved in cell wall biosynthesis
VRFVVCSYNRGAFLQHCIETIERCAPGYAVTVMDDSSDDPETINILDTLAARHEVISSASLSGHKHGGLYDNMQTALERSDEELICFLQDDTQLVRPLEPRDEDDLQAAFESAPDLAFVSPCFVRGIALKHKQDRDFRFDAVTGLWYWHPQKRSTGSYYSDVVVAHRSRLQGAGWRFEQGESANDRQARRTFRRMGHMAAPFAMWLPNVPTYRGKRKTLALRRAERYRKSGFYRLQRLDPEQVSTIRNRATQTPPLAEDWLQNEGGALDRPWNYDPMQGLGWLKLLDRFERWLRTD